MRRILWPFLFGLGLIAFITYSRYAFRFPYLYSWDSVQFALSIKEFDVLKHQPHPPGYIFYCGVLKILHQFVTDPNEAMIFMNIAASIFASFFIYLVVYELTDGIDENRRLLFAIGAAAIYATNPIVWFYGCVSEIYAVESFLVAVLIYFLVLSKKRPSLLPFTSILFGVAGGVRLTTELFLLPAYVLVLLGINKRTLIASLLCFLISNLLWFIPVVYFSHGLEEYLNALFSQGMREPETTAGFDSENILEILLSLIQAITIPILVALLLRLRKIRVGSFELLLLLALLPALFFFLFVHFPKYGYLLAIIPTLIVLSIYLLQRSIHSFSMLVGILCLAILLNFLIFTKPPILNAAEVKSNTSRWVLYKFTFPNIHARNLQAERFQMFFQTISELGNSKRLFIVQKGSFPGFRILMFYYPDDVVITPQSMKRVTMGLNHNSASIPKPIPLSEQDRIVIVVGEKPKQSQFQSLKVEGRTFYYAFLKELPKTFQIYSIPFARHKTSGL